MKSVVIGTAGHIDHGKTSLVKALTGIDADRLEEEKRRGITIDLGFAHLDTDGLRLSFIDVPGHEKFVRNMLAGVGGVDLVLFTIAADEGVMPQTREHFEICRLLGIPGGIIALTKADLISPELLQARREELSKFLAGSFLDLARTPLIPVSSITGEGIDDVRAALTHSAKAAAVRNQDALLRLPIDRVFTMRGFGTVVTGTLLSGTISRDSEIEVQPGGKRARIRGIQVHAAAVDKAHAGERTALNLSGVAKEDLVRGQTIVSSQTLAPTHRFEAWIELTSDAKPLKTKARVHLHAFTSDAIAEVTLRDSKELAPGAAAFAQLRLADDGQAILLVPGDRFILRQFSPVVTIGGGTVLDAHPFNKRLAGPALAQFLTVLRDGSPQEKLLARITRRGANGMALSDAVRDTGATPAELHALAGELERKKQIVTAGGSWVAQPAWEDAQQRTLEEMKLFHGKNPLAAGIGREALRERTKMREPVFSALIEALVREGRLRHTQEVLHLAEHKVVLRSEESAAHKQIEDAFKSAGLKVPAMKEVLMSLPLDRTRAQKIVAILLRDKVLVKISEDLVFHASALSGLRATLAKEKARSPQLDVARFKEITGVSRKYAIPLLEWLDRERVTRRVGDARVIL